MKNNLKFSYLGKQPYQDTYQDMREHIQNFSSNQIWMLEHDAVFTLGTAADESHIINAGQIPVIQTDRGGEVTYHGPGQLVISITQKFYLFLAGQ